MIRAVTATCNTKPSVRVHVRITSVLPQNLRLAALGKITCTHEEWSKLVHATHPHMLFLLYICFCSEKDLLSAFATELYEIRFTTRFVQVKRKQFLKNFMMSLRRYCTGELSSEFCKVRRAVVPRIYLNPIALPVAIHLDDLSVFAPVKCRTFAVDESQQRYVLMTTGGKLSLIAVISVEEDARDKNLIDAKDCLFNCSFQCFCTETNREYVMVRNFLDLVPD